MKPFILNGQVWRVVGVDASDPRLIDRTGTKRLATSDSASHTICLWRGLKSPLLDRVLLHEIAHAVTASYDLLRYIHQHVPQQYWIPIEEWASNLVSDYSIEIAAMASRVLGRPVCVEGYCHD